MACRHVEHQGDLSDSVSESKPARFVKSLSSRSTTDRRRDSIQKYPKANLQTSEYALTRNGAAGNRSSSGNSPIGTNSSTGGG